MKLEVVLSLFLLAAVSALGADEVNWQWRTPLALGEGESGGLRCSSKDSAGNLLVGWTLSGPTQNKAVVSKVDATGTEVWRFALNYAAGFAVPEIGTDSAGNVYFITATSEIPGSLDQLMVVKLSPSGQEVWRCPLGEDALLHGYMDFTMSSSGTVWVSYREDWAPDSGIAVKRISSEGDIIWSRDWTANVYYSPSYRPGKVLAVDESENVHMAWQTYVSDGLPEGIMKSFLRKIDSEGALVWEKEISSLLVMDMMLGPDGAICLSGLGGYALFDSGGKLTGRVGTLENRCQILDFLPDGRFLVTWSSPAGSVLQLTKPDLQPAWRAPLNSINFAGFAKNPAGGWFLGGYRFISGDSPSIVTVMESVALDGTRRWRQENSPVIQVNGPTLVSMEFLMEAFSDRLCVFGNDAAEFATSSVVAAQFSLPATLPASLFDTLPADGIWQKGQPFSLSVIPAGAGLFSYRWYRQGVLLPGQTGPTLELSIAQFPSAHGYYHAEVTSGDVTTTSTAALVDLDGIHMESLGLTESGYHKLRICAPVGTSFALESSNDLIHWEPGYVSTNHFETTEERYTNGSARFFRAVKVE